MNKPTLIVNEKICRANILSMAVKARRSGCRFRPHFKTHYSLEIGRWFADAGVAHITVSSVSMAEYFSTEWKNITIAFPVNIRELSAINQLATRIQLNLLLESVEVAKMLGDKLDDSVGVFIKIDVGTKRTGLTNDAIEIDHTLDVINKSDNLEFLGFLAHAGHSYQCRSTEEISKVYLDTTAQMNQLKNKYRQDFPELILSYGDTPTCSVIDNLEVVDEIRPGNFVFYDLMQWQITSCQLDNIAVCLACPIVAIHKERGEVVIYGGAVHFSKEVLTHSEYGPLYGLMLKHVDMPSELISGAYVKRLSQEHGIVHMPDMEIKQLKIGDLLYILPVHSCLTMNLMRQFSIIIR